MRLARHVFADLIEMQLHGLGVGPGQHEGYTCAAFGANCAEQIGVVVTLIGRQTGSGSLTCPDTNLPVLLSNPGFILKPNLNGRSLGQIGYLG